MIHIKLRRRQHYIGVLVVPEDMVIRIILPDIAYSLLQRPLRFFLTIYSLHGSVIIETNHKEAEFHIAVHKLLQVLDIAVPVEKPRLLVYIKIRILKRQVHYAHGEAGKRVRQEYPRKEKALKHGSDAQKHEK